MKEQLERSYPLAWRRLQWAILGWVDRPCLSEKENLTSGRAPCYIWGPNNDDYVVSAQDAVQNNSPLKNYILLASWYFLVSPCPRTPALSKPFLLPTLFANDWQSQDRWWSHHWGGLRPEQGWSPVVGSASSCPGLWREGEESFHIFKKTFAPPIGWDSTRQ